MEHQEAPDYHLAWRAAWAVAAAATVANLLHPGLLALHGSSPSAVIETGAMLAGALVAYLSYGRWRQTALVGDLLVSFALAVIALGHLLFAVLPLVAVGLQRREAVGAAALSGATGAVVLLCAAFLRSRTAPPSPRPARDAVVFMLGVLAAVALTAAVGSRIGFRSSSSLMPSVEAIGDPHDLGITGLQLSIALALGVAGVLFIRRPGGGTLFSPWLAVAATFWAFARVNFALTPHRLSTALTVGSWLRCAAYAILVMGAATEIRAYWRGAAERATLEERRRIARELHDGLAQELAFIAGQSVILARREPSSRRAQLLRSAAERALDESRRAIAALSRPLDEPLDVAVAQTAEEVATRLGTRLHLDLAEHVTVPADARDALVRIVREAVTNAVRHGQASRVSVSLANSEGVTLVVADNGRGFEPGDLRRDTGRLGITSMRERAEAVGGVLDIASRPYGGTLVTAHLP